MEPKIKKIIYEQNYNFSVVFENGVKGTINFEPLLWGEVFEKVKNKEYFKKAFVDETTGTITWPNGADFAPETLYEQVKAGKS